MKKLFFLFFTLFELIGHADSQNYPLVITGAGATISPALYSTHIATTATPVGSMGIVMPSGNTGDYFIVIFNKSVSSITYSGTGSSTEGFTAPSIAGITKVYKNTGGNWY